MSLAAQSTLAGALRGVQRRERLRRGHTAARHALWGAAGTLLALGAARLLGLLAAPLAPAVAGAVVVGTLLGALRWARQRPPTPLDAARTADRRAGLSGLLATALTLPEHAPDPWEAALHARVHARAHEAAAALRPDALLPLPPARRWAGPAALLLVAAGLWWPAPLSVGRGAGDVPRAAAVDEPAPGPPAATAGATPAPESSAPTVNEPTPEPDVPQTSSATPAAAKGQASDAAGVKAPSAQASTSAPATGRTAGDKLREARQGVTSGTAGDSSTASAAPQRSTRDTPFGSRESGQFQNQSVTPAETLASAPYDPATAPGAQPMQQKSDPGSSALRAASGGRGLESEGADRCVQGCLTNNDMNRGAPQPAARKKPPGGETRSGTSDSGGGAAGSSSGVGLGVGTLNPLRSASTTDLGGSGVLGDSVQVLAAPDTEDKPVASGAAAAGPWRAAPEALSVSPDIPPDARDAVRTYFDRTAPPLPTAARTTP
ncbi:hypothetical protein HNQ07_000368 [Deinococcus metalli]|uniref:Uncharacterized protein n=1 Tax=Deinococcus metalli TaxID=1141878 RepID=A0A7W8KE87_9DEIO|nr:hypothetical protein [Deinococcus metalli]MBB5374924.1 hypothetical protein [Deinococcus metalli]GHF32680.1 hypothetical protein GCM10017781_06730 [Deinococcus metalli]